MFNLSLPWKTSPLADFFRRRTPALGPAAPQTLVNRHIFILPSRTGLAFVLLLVLIVSGATNYNNNLAFVLGFLLTGLGLVAMLQTYRNLAGLRLQAIAAEPGPVGGTARFRLRLIAPDPRIAVGIRPRGMAPVYVDLPGRYEPVSVTLDLPAARRGWLELGRIEVFTGYPFNLFHCWSRLEAELRTWVYPAPAPSGVPVPPGSREPSTDGDQGRGQDDFRGFRSYHPGDSLKLVDWKAVARGLDLHLKEFGGDRLQEHHLSWDDLPGLDAEARLRQLCRWVLDLDARAQAYALRLPDASLPLGRGPLHRDSCLRALALQGYADQ